jgi:uncharacterized iron-regulated membrane protein
MNWKKSHRWVAILITLPLALIVITGLVLQVRNQFEFIQPAAVQSEMREGTPLLTFEQILSSVERKDLDQIIYRPGKKNLAVRYKDGTELQLHPQTGELQKKAIRRTNILIELHQGSLFGPAFQYGVHVMTGLGLFFLIISGIVIFPFKRRRP